MNENEIVVAGNPVVECGKPMSAEMVLEQVQIIKRIQNQVMKLGTHYGQIPGCGETPVLLKPGAEKICMTFRIGAEPDITREYDGYDTHFHVRTRMFDIPTGRTLGYGVGDGSTSESKWAWRKAVCHEEYEVTPETKRRNHWQVRYQNKKKCYNPDGSLQYEAVEQVRQNPADIVNTVLKMTTKRAMVDGCRNVTACSDVFEQDLDESHIADAIGNPAENPAEGRFQAPRQKAQYGADPAAQPGEIRKISDAQRKRLYAIGKERGLSDDEMGFLVSDIAKVNRSGDIPAGAIYNEVAEAFSNAVPGQVIPVREHDEP